MMKTLYCLEKFGIYLPIGTASYPTEVESVLLACQPIPRLEHHPLSVVYSYSVYSQLHSASGGFLRYLHPEDVLCHGDRDPLSMDLTSVVGNEIISIKVEEVPHMKEEDDPGQIESPFIKAEPVVSCVCVCVCVCL
jgi:hypothetical protein